MFSSIVELYRASDRPTVAQSVFHYDGELSARLRQALQQAQDLSEENGRFEHAPYYENGTVSFAWRLMRNESGGFYSTIANLVALSDSAHQGQRPDNFYLIDLDYMSSEANCPPELSRLYSICDLIRHLEMLSGHTPSETHPTQPKVLFFMLPANEGTPPRAAKIITRIPADSLEGPPLDLSPLAGVLDEQYQASAHYFDRQALFRLAVAEVAAGAPSPQQIFGHLIANWGRVLEKFRYDTECYVNQFAFDKLLAQIADMQLDFASRLTKVMSETATKFLGLPLPVVALVGILHSKDIVQSYLIFLGAFVLALLYSALVHNQLLEVERVDSAYKVTFTRFARRHLAGKLGIDEHLQQSSDAFDEQRTFLIRTLVILRVLAWLPIAGGLGLLAYRYHPGFNELSTKLFQKLWD